MALAFTPTRRWRLIGREAVEAENYRELVNQIRPHEAIGMCRPSMSSCRPSTTADPKGNEPTPCTAIERRRRIGLPIATP